MKRSKWNNAGREKNKGPIRNGREILKEQLEDFIVEQMETYIRLHKEHEKDLRYIG